MSGHENQTHHSLAAVDLTKEENRDLFIVGNDQRHYHTAVDDHGSLRRTDHAIVRFGVDELLPKKITLVHGPGCPVCVTPVELIDKGIEVAERPKVIFCSFGDIRAMAWANCSAAFASRYSSMNFIPSPPCAAYYRYRGPHATVS